MRWTLVILTCLVVADPAHAYSQFTTDGGARLRWTMPRVRWVATERGVPGVTPSEFQAALARAFKTWEDVPTASVAFEFAGFTSAEPEEDDSLSVIGFQSHPELERVLGATSFLFDEDTGAIIEADIYFNSQFEWSTAASGDAGRFDLESVAAHEIGHFLGLGHSAIGETEIRAEGGRRVLGSGAVMFPISLGRGSIADRTLQPDDIAGISDLYPDAGFEESTGGVHGRVRHGPAGALGAHVIAFDLRTRALVGGFALSESGEFQILGLRPGAYVIRVEPLDDADVESFFSSDRIDVDFQVTYYQRLVAAPAGGVGDPVDITVRPK